MLKELQEFGLSREEASVYLALLRMGSGKVSEIARRANLHRTSAYNVLETLTSKGLVSFRTHLNHKYYVAENPSKILDFLQNKKNKYDAKIALCSKLVPELSELYREPESKPFFHYYEGIKGLKDAYEDTLTSTETIRAYTPVDDIQTCLPDYFPDYYKRRARKGIHLRALFPATIQSINRRKFDKVEERTSVLIPRSFDFHLEINIYNDKMAIISIKEKFAVIIESKELAYAQKQIFDLAWEAAEVYDKKICSQGNVEE
ncbi:MAG: helix-turn-helix domain-containing protein [Candidatus Gracilibacteria bacterium]|nr:helix-turn-helix domain-containing protein [Candidatus Gracilibacteria bacterium]